MRTVASCVASVAIGYAVAALVGWLVGLLGDSFVLTREQLIDNDAHVLNAHAMELFLVATAGLVIIVACGTLAAGLSAALLSPATAPAIWIATGAIVLLGLMQVLVTGRNLWLCLFLLAVWPGCAYLANRVRRRKQSAS